MADLLKSQLNLYFYNICSFYYLNNHMVSSQIMFNKTYQICSFYFCWELSGYNLWAMISSFLGFPGGSEGKASVYNVGDLGSIPGSGRSPGEGNGNYSSTLAWKSPWTEKPGRLQPVGLQRVGHDFTFTFTFFLFSIECMWHTQSDGNTCIKPIDTLK